MAKKHYFRYKKANEITSTLIDNTLTKTNKVNDFTDGSIIKTLYEAFSTELEMFYYLTIENIKGGVWNSVYNAFDFARKPETRAYGDVIVTFNSALSSDITIPKGTKVSSTSNYYDETYRTAEEYLVKKGSTYARFTVYCDDGGSVGNIPSNVLDTASGIINMDTITNPEAFSTGQDEESDSDVRVRFREFIQSLQRGTVQALQYGAKTVPYVDGVYVAESIGRVVLYAHDKNGDLSDELQQEVQNEMPYWRPAGVPVVVLPIHKTLVDMNVVVEVPNQNLATAQFKEYVRATIVNYINNMKVHDNLVHADVIQKIMDLNDLGITNSRADIMVTPDAYKRGAVDVDEYTSLYLNGKAIDRDNLYPKNRSHAEDYIVSNPEDKDEEHVAYFDNNESGEAIESNNSYTSEYKPTGDVLDSLEENYIPIDTKSFISDSTVQLGRDTLKSMKVAVEPLAQPVALTDSVSAYTAGDISTTIKDSGKDPDSGTTTQATDGRQKDGTYVYRVQMPDGMIVRVQFDIDSRVRDIVVTPKEEIYQIHTVKNFTTKGLTVSTIQDNKYKDSKYISEQDSVTMNDYKVSNNLTQVTFRGSDGSTLAINYVDGMIYYNYDMTSVKVSVNGVDNQKTITVDEGKGTVSSTTFTLDDKLIGSITDYTNLDNTVTTMVRDSSNTVTRVIIKDINGKVVSDTDNPEIPTGTTTSTTTSTTQKPTTTTTTTTTTSYPFSYPETVDAQDAPLDGYLPVFSKYETGVDEILRARNINIIFTTDMAVDDGSTTIVVPTTTTTTMKPTTTTTTTSTTYHRPNTTTTTSTTTIPHGSTTSTSTTSSTTKITTTSTTTSSTTTSSTTTTTSSTTTTTTTTTRKLDAPDAPTLSVSGYNGSVTLTLRDPSYTGKSPITSRTIYYTSGGSEQNVVIGSKTTTTLTNLSEGVSYSFTATVTNSVGESPRSNVAVFTPRTTTTTTTTTTIPQYYASLSLSPSTDNYEVQGTPQSIQVDTGRAYAPTFTDSQWRSATGNMKGSSGNPNICPPGYSSSWYLSDIYENPNSVHFALSTSSTYAKTETSNRPYIRSRYVNFNINNGRPYESGQIYMDGRRVGTFSLNGSGYASGGFTVPSNTFSNGNHTVSLSSSYTHGSANYYATAKTVTQYFNQDRMKVGATVNGHVYGV